MDEKRANGLCYYCDEKYTAEHKCSRRKQLFILELEEELEDSLWEDELEESENSEESALNPQFSVHALNGTSNYRTMRVKGAVKGKMVHILIDSGSTHNFMDLVVAKKLGCRLKTIPSFVVSVEDGSKVHSSVMTVGVTWKMQGVDFKADMLVIPLGGADLVLNIQWLITLGDIRWNFKQLKMEFQIGGRKVSLKGSQPGAFKVVADVRMQKVLNKPSQIHMMLMVFIQPSQEANSVQETRITSNSQ